MPKSKKNEDVLANPNTWEFVRQQRRRLTVTETQHPFLEGLEHTWQKISSDYGQLFQREEDEKFASTPLKALGCLVDMGFYPPPEILLSILACFELYYSSGGEIELEDVFFGPRKRGVGNNAAALGHDSVYSHFHFRHSFLEKDNEKQSLAEQAEEMFTFFNLSDVDIDNFLRGYRRWKERQKNE